MEETTIISLLSLLVLSLSLLISIISLILSSFKNIISLRLIRYKTTSGSIRVDLRFTNSTIFKIKIRKIVLVNDSDVKEIGVSERQAYILYAGESFNKIVEQDITPDCVVRVRIHYTIFKIIRLYVTRTAGAEV